MTRWNRGEQKYHHESHPEDQKLLCNAAPACRKGDFTGAVVRPVIHRTGESKQLLACQKSGQENGGVKGKMVIREKNSFSPEKQDAVKTRCDFAR